MNIISTNKSVKIEDIFFNGKVLDSLNDFLEEIKYREFLENQNLPVSNKLLFHGPSGCGKTLTALAIANELGYKIHIVNLSSIVSYRLGETASNISKMFHTASYTRSVLFLDEFDSLITVRDKDQSPSGEMRRVTNTIIQLLDNLDKDTILIAATNQLNLIDDAITRRFEYRLLFEKPDHALLDRYYGQLFKNYGKPSENFPRQYGISFAEAKTHVQQYLKKIAILDLKNKSL